MHIEKTNGDELILHGTEGELDAALKEIREKDPGAKGTKYKEGETVRLKNGTGFIVTKEGLLAAKLQLKKKKLTRLKNKSARCARKKMRSRRCH